VPIHLRFFFLPWEKISFFCVHNYKDQGASMKTLSSLTPRELEVLELVIAGYTNKAIAAEIFISEKTVEFHLDNIYTKVGARTRLMAGVWALQHGLLTASSEFSR
jgi:DNA-binding NarL/FixJ family response regulator